MLRVLPILLGAGFTVATCLAAGLPLIRSLRLRFDRVEQLLFAFLGGAAIVSTVVFALCAVHLARAGAFTGIGLLAMGASVRWGRSETVQRKQLPASKWFYFSLLAALFLLYFFNALAPEVSPDGSGYHLGNVLRMAEHHGFDWDYHSIYAAFPQGLEMLFLFAYEFGGMSAAAMVHFSFLCVLAGLLVAHGNRIGHPRAGLFAAVLVFGSPVIGLTGVSAYNDVALATSIYAVFYLTEVVLEEKQLRSLILIGLLVGFCFSIKYTGWVALPYVIVRLRGRQLVKLLIPAGAVALPWVVRNWIWIGNPLAPFFNRWFPNLLYSADLESAYLSDLRHVEGFRHWWQMPLDLTIYGAKLPGFLGPVFLLAPLAVLALRYPVGRRLLAASAVFSLAFVFNPAARFLIPGIPFLAVAMGIATENSRASLGALAAFHALLAAPAVMPSYCADWAWRIRAMPVRVALGSAPEDPYVSRFVPDFWLKAPIEENVRKQQKIFTFATRPEAYLRREFVVGYESLEGDRIARAVRAEEKAEVLKNLGVDFVLLNDGDFNSADINRNAKRMGLTLIEKRNGTAFYRVD